jgi:diguanylate cyclase (GGDEF)-like protein
MLLALRHSLRDWCTRTVAHLSVSDVLVSAIAAMSLAIFGGYIYADRQQAEIAQITDEAREMRRARQALMEVDAAVVHAMAELAGAGAPEAYFRATERLAKHDASHFPETMVHAGQSVPTSQLIGELRAAWSQAWIQLAQGKTGDAKTIYMKQQAGPILTDVVAAMYHALDAKEVRYSALNDRLNFVTSAVLALQILTGIACAFAFRASSRHMQRESETRALAVTSANDAREQVMRLFEMADMLQSATDGPDANAVFKATASELMPGLGGALYVFNNSRDRLVLSSSWGLASAQAAARAGWRKPETGGSALPETLALNQCWALKRGKPHINQPHSHKLCCEHHVGDLCVLELPMVARGEILGMLQIFASGADAVAQLEQIRAIGAALADGMSLALSSIKLREKLRGQALRDPLTGLYNRRYMEDTLERFSRLAEREKRELSVIMIDLDHFKRLNDQHGHAKGDAVLRDSAAAIIGKLRETDVACRYGGEELIVLLPDCNLDMAVEKAETIRASIEALSEPDGAKVSASLGVATYGSYCNSTRSLVAAADAALYQAKQSGRNRVMRAAMRSDNSEVAKDDAASLLIAAE